MKKSGKKKSISMIRRAVTITTVSSLIMTLACVFVASVFFERITIGIYEQMEKSITGSAYQNANKDDLAFILNETADVINSMEDPVKSYNENRDEFIEKFALIQDHGIYKDLWNYFNTTRKSTESTCFVLVMIYPEKDFLVYVMDASDFNVMPCGELLEDDFKRYAGNPGMDFMGFNTISPTYGPVRTDGVPVYVDEEKDIYAYLLADIPVSEVRHKGILFIINTALLALFITALI